MIETLLLDAGKVKAIFDRILAEDESEMLFETSTEREWFERLKDEVLACVVDGGDRA